MVLTITKIGKHTPIIGDSHTITNIGADKMPEKDIIEWIKKQLEKVWKVYEKITQHEVLSKNN